MEHAAQAASSRLFHAGRSGRTELRPQSKSARRTAGRAPEDHVLAGAFDARLERRGGRAARGGFAHRSLGRDEEAVAARHGRQRSPRVLRGCLLPPRTERTGSQGVDAVAARIRRMSRAGANDGRRGVSKVDVCRQAAGGMIKGFVKGALETLGYTVNGIRHQPRQLLDRANLRTLEFDDVVCRRMFEVGPTLTFVQIGAFDGTTADPLRKYIERCAWRGVLVEPQSRAAEKLRDLYRGNGNVIVMQAAVDAIQGTRVLFTASSEAVPAWVGGLASFTREAIAKHRDIVPQ